MVGGMTLVSLRILCELQFPTSTVRFIDASSSFIDGDGNLWRPATLTEGALDSIETAINAEAWTLSLRLSGITPEIANLAWQETEAGQVIGSTVRILIQECDENDQPEGNLVEKFRGMIDNIIFDEAATDDQVEAGVTIECVNRFTLRTATSGSVLSDVDQQARAAVLNPTAPADRFAERVPGMIEKVILWPTWD